MYCGVPTICPARVSGAPGGGGDLGQAEVDELGHLAVLVVGRKQDVGRLQVAVDDAGRVRRVEAPARGACAMSARGAATAGPRW